MTEKFPDTVLAFDFGMKRIGVAVGSRLTAGAQPLTTIAATDDNHRFEAIARLIAEWQPQRLVVGHPAHPDGQPLRVTARCERFARQLRGRFGLPVELVDENYSSVEADRDDADWGPAPRGGRENGPRRHDDARAAAIILRQYWGSIPPP